jgi:hypothetical protein
LSIDSARPNLRKTELGWMTMPNRLASGREIAMKNAKLDGPAGPETIGSGGFVHLPNIGSPEGIAGGRSADPG